MSDHHNLRVREASFESCTSAANTEISTVTCAVSYQIDFKFLPCLFVLDTVKTRVVSY